VLSWLAVRHPSAFYGWTVVGSAAVIVAMGLCALFSLTVFIEPIEESMVWSRPGISTIALVNWMAMGVDSFLWGMLSDRFGTRVVVLAGGALLGLGLVLCSRSRFAPLRRPRGGGSRRPLNRTSRDRGVVDTRGLRWYQFVAFRLGRTRRNGACHER
jgi:MFS family permease